MDITEQRHPLDVILNSEDGIIDVFTENVKEYLILTDKKQFYLWYPNDYLWKPITTEIASNYMITVMKAIICHYHCDFNDLQDPIGLKLSSLLVKLGQKTFKERLFRSIKQDNTLFRSDVIFNSSRGEIPLVDGKLLDLISGEITIRTPKDLWICNLQVNYSSLSTNPEKRDKVVDYFRVLCRTANDKTDPAKSARKLDYIQRLLGYFLTGENSDHKIYIWYGPGLNGKSTLARIIKRIFGDFVGSCPSGLLTGPPSQLEKLRYIYGKRLIFIHDLDDDTPVNLKTLKILLGDDISTIKPPKIVIITDTLPTLSKSGRTSPEVLDRYFRIIPFEVNFVKMKEEIHGEYDYLQIADLEKKLESLYPEIFSWIVEGSKRYYHQSQDFTLI
jgi:hypothetical protein